MQQAWARYRIFGNVAAILLAQTGLDPNSTLQAGQSVVTID